MNRPQNDDAAFPLANDSEKQYHWINQGMSLRDYFAGMALQGLATQPSKSFNDSMELAKVAYVAADSMLAARKAPSGLEG